MYQILIDFYVMFFNSHVEPSPNNRAANSLAKDIQIRNVRKVKVNANITCIMWIMEWLGNLSLLLTWSLRHGHVYSNVFDGTMITTIFYFWYYVLIPNLYLMNTGHNKDLIIDEGFVSTIRNGLRIPLDMNIYQFLPHWVMCRGNEDPVCNVTAQQQTLNDKNLKPSSKQQKQLTPTFNTELDTISKWVSNEVASKNRGNVSPTDISRNPSTSNINSESSERHPNVPFIDPKRSSESDEEKDNLCSQKNLHLQLLKDMLSIMEENIENEENYLFYFVQLADYMNRSRKDESSAMNFEVVKISKPLQLSDASGSSRKGKRKNKTYNMSQYLSVQNLTLFEILVGNVSDRIRSRRLLLGKHKDEKSYDRYLTELFELEESFIAH